MAHISSMSNRLAAGVFAGALGLPTDRAIIARTRSHVSFQRRTSNSS
jgi:hypothetical protein